MALVPFHYRLADFSTVRVECADLHVRETTFYREYFRQGLSEFRFRQGLDPTRAIDIISADNDVDRESQLLDTEPKILMLNGGGKDTVVMAELMKSCGIPVAWCTVNPGSRQNKVIAASDIQESHVVRYKLDENILRHARYKWGHTPVSSIYMSLSLVPALARRFRYVTTGNEYSANFGNYFYNGTELNHQYTKSYAFEHAYNQYLEDSVVKGVSYFSALRPFYDIKLAAMLSKLTGYLDAFVSCNSGPGWCGQCSKCAWTFLALTPFLGIEKTISIFSKDLFQHQVSRKLILNLVTGLIKPWECVGTRAESRLAP
jgi:hypothetical protein